MKWNIEEAKNKFNEKGLVLLENEFKNVDTKMKCIAKCGHEKELSLYNLIKDKGLKCKECTNKERANKRKYTFGYVKEYFEKEGCILLSEEYNRWDQKLIYIARCGHKNEINFNKFKSTKQGRLCCKCRFKRGKEHHKYNENLTDKERINNRDYYEIQLWRLKVYEKDNYTCKCCGDSKGGNLNAHHLNGYNWDVENRLNIDNGITLCEKCHTEFHNKYGYGNNTKEQFNEWKKLERT
jgi:hypothetical protein